MATNFLMVKWAEGANIYEVNIRQYTGEGTFAAFAKSLPRLKNMGVQILWLMPITQISVEKRLGELGSYYSCSSYTKINSEFGTLDDFKALVKEAHELGFKLIIDWVANHTGWDHDWTKTHPDWYKKDEEGNFTEVHGWKDVIDLNYDNICMRNAMIDAMQFWIAEFHIDGFRCDMAHLVPLDFWKDAREKCDAIKPLFWLAECEVKEYHEVFDVSYAWEWMHVTEKFMRGEATLSDVRNVLIKYAQYSQGALKLFFTTNHDENSWNGTEYEKYGNAAKAFAVFTCTWKGMPLIYSGQELPNFKRLSFFNKDKIDWDNMQPALHQFYKTLLSLRKTNTAFYSNAKLINLSTTYNDEILAYLCINGNDKVLSVINFSNAERLKFSITHDELNGIYENVFSEFEYNFKKTVSFELQPWEYAVYSAVLTDDLSH
ncbi:MAG: alpha-amylase family glycosyl hydrolase [Chitinophagaceae bacterium]